MATAFSQTFSRLRRQGGFETAYKFYHKNGGRKVFQCSFPNYLRIENGSHLPRPDRLPRLCTLLRLPLGGNAMRELVGAYLETWLGSRELLDWMLSSFSRPPGARAPGDPASQALSKVVNESGRPVSVLQFEAIMATAASYWCYRVLTTSKESHSAADLSRLLGLKTAAISRALESLARVKIAKRQSDGSYASPLAGQFLVFPDSHLIPANLRDRAFLYNQEMIKKRGTLVDVRFCGLRADGGQIQGFIPHFREAIRSVNAYAVTEKTERSGLFFVEGRLYKLLDF